MKVMRFFAILTGFFLLQELLLDPAHGWAGDRPVLSALVKGKAKIIGWNGYVQNAEPGRVLEVGEIIETDETASALLTYPDGSRALLGPGTKFEVKAKIDGVETNELSKGSVRGIIRKLDRKAVRHHYLFKNRAAVMGVRGTDFVMSFDGVNSDTRVLEGLVEVAGDEGTLAKGAGAPVKGGEWLANAPSTGMPGAAVKSFEPTEYERELDGKRMTPETFGLDPKNPFAGDPESDLETRIQETHLSRFRLGASYIFQRNTLGWDYTAQLSWNPQVRLMNRLGLVGYLAGFPLRLGSPRQWVLCTRVGLGGRVSLTRGLSAEAGVGHESWGKYTNAGPFYFAHLILGASPRSAPIRGLVLGMSFYDRKGAVPDPTAAYYVGIEFGSN
jgi:hypothetical protein